ncbi:hypothetical protein AgCh_013208 [Apium graveolens]
MMLEGGNPSRYVKLTKEQAARTKGIRPSELNQSIDVPELSLSLFTYISLYLSLQFIYLNVRKCNECGQPLPESFEFPVVEPWSMGIFGCTEDKDSFDRLDMVLLPLCFVWA